MKRIITITIAFIFLIGCSNSNKEIEGIKFVNLNKKEIKFDEDFKSNSIDKESEPILAQDDEVWNEFSSGYKEKLNEGMKKSDYTKYTIREKEIYNYMQSIWDIYELKYGIAKAEKLVFTKTAEKYNISEQEVLRIFNKVDKTIFEY